MSVPSSLAVSIKSIIEMIVVFVIDTSPSMSSPATNTGITGVSRLDVAKMAVESLSRSLDKRIVDHNRSVLVASAQKMAGKQIANDCVGRLEQFDEFLLLSTSLQSDASAVSRKEGRKRSNSFDGKQSSLDSIEVAAEIHASCGAGGRLLFGCVDSERALMPIGSSPGQPTMPHPPNRGDFEKELKRLKAASFNGASNSFPDWAGGATGLNTALSHGLGLLSRYRLTRGRIVEHFGMGRLPWFEHQMTAFGKDKEDHNASRNNSPLQPACLILLTDGECLRLPPEKGGGSLRLQFGNMPLREFYKERKY